MKTALLQFIDAAIEKIRNLFKSIFDRKDNALEYDFNNDCLDEEIEQRDRRIKLFNKEVGSNPLDHIDWIIENGLAEYNEKYQYFISGNYERDEKVRRFEEWGKHTSALIKTQEKKEREIRLNLDQVMEFHMRKEEAQRRNDTVYFTELRGGIGNKVIHSFVEYSSEHKTFKELFDEVEDTF